MSDLIRREDVLSILRAFGWTPIDGLYLVVEQDIPSADRPSAVDLSSVYSTAYKSGYEKGNADRPQGWIPCSERLPRARESVLIAVNHKYGDWVGEGCYWETTENHIIWKGYRWNATYWDDEIIAWMPLPQPMKGADDD